MRWAVVLCAILIGSGFAFGQISTEEAMSKLKAKQDARDVDRTKLVTITQGELDDLKAEVASLQSQVAQLRAANGGGAAPAAAAAAPARDLAVGLTRDQVLDFVKRRPNEYELLGDDVSTPHTMARTTVAVVQKQETDSVQRQGTNAIDQRTGLNVAANQSENVKDAKNEDVKSREITTVEGDKTEEIRLMRKIYKSVQTGAHQEYNGVTHSTVQDTSKQWVPSERLFVKIVNGQVTSIDRRSAL